ncbi:hypothetical protein CspeluHIS016_0401360 [Cutaneotrichosporon spelunceum]|uniref:RRM domain-containing protein n=1 Tax=Cutaneotrichosporon spelunceum TaxID=1672016 RepID=A0AAD3TUS8_9TREE|nr:hypothetical protein CspeluHIS016_0401360 [Cutaneotrichosporon spelunceum]
MSGSYNRGGYPAQHRYSSTPAYDNVPGFRPPMPPTGLPPFPPRNFPTPPIPPPMPPTNTFRSPYEEYNSAAAYPPPQSKLYNNSDAYDPYQPAAYDPGTPALRSTQQTMSYTPPGPSYPTSTRPGELLDLHLLTPPTTLTIGDYTATVHSLPQSHLPITKYVSVNAADAVDLHRAICQSGMAQAIWYADGQCRAGEGWGAAVEWVLETGMSRSKMRTCAGQTDSLGTELAAINKATEGFRDHLNQSIKSQMPMSHEFVLFTSSAAAVVSIDTSSRPESLHFCSLWREICTDFLKAHLTIVHLPKGSDVEGYVLAEKIANVAASNSYTKRKKDRALDEFYNRPGGGEAAPGGSTEAGPWQRGDADPSRRKSPFERPRPLPTMSPERNSPTPPPPHAGMSSSRTISPPSHSNSRNEASNRRSISLDAPPRRSPAEEPFSNQSGAGEEDIQPRDDGLVVTHFPAQACAKDLGILFAQFGDITSVDIFSVGPGLPRFAFVAYADVPDRLRAIEGFHNRPIDLGTPFARENAVDLEVWKGWNGTLSVVMSDPERLVPLSIAKDYPDLPPYATQRRMVLHKRDRTNDDGASTPPSKKPRAGSDAADQPPSLPPRPHGLPPRPSFDASDPTPPSATNGPAPHTHQLPSTPLTASAPSASLTASDEGPVKISGKTLQAQIDLVQNVYVKHDRDNWIAHTCLIATDLDQIRRSLQADLYATDEASISCRDLEAKLSDRGFTLARMDAVVAKVLKVLDNMAAEDETELSAAAEPQEPDTARLQAELAHVLRDYPPQTREAMASAATVLEYLNRGKDAQEAKRLEAERRAGVLEGIVQKGEQVRAVVRFLLSS